MGETGEVVVLAFRRGGRGVRALGVDGELRERVEGREESG